MKKNKEMVRSSLSANTRLPSLSGTTAVSGREDLVINHWIAFISTANRISFRPPQVEPAPAPTIVNVMSMNFPTSPEYRSTPMSPVVVTVETTAGSIYCIGYL